MGTAEKTTADYYYCSCKISLSHNNPHPPTQRAHFISSKTEQCGASGEFEQMLQKLSLTMTGNNTEGSDCDSIFINKIKALLRHKAGIEEASMPSIWIPNQSSHLEMWVWLPNIPLIYWMFIATQTLHVPNQPILYFHLQWSKHWYRHYVKFFLLLHPTHQKLPKYIDSDS